MNRELADLGSASADQIGLILADSHPLMVEAFMLASLPRWYDLDLFKAMRNMDDGREKGLIIRLDRYSFISALEDREGDEPAYFVRPHERAILQERWIAEDPQAFREAHQRALDYWIAQPDPSPLVQEQNRLYHQFFVDLKVGFDDLVHLFQTYSRDRQLPAIQRLLATAREAQACVALLEGEIASGFDDLLAYLEARLAQLRGRWAESLRSLEALRQKEHAPSDDLVPYVMRAQGQALRHEGHYVEAIGAFEDALRGFGEQADAGSGPETIRVEMGHTMIALGDAHVDLAVSASGQPTRGQREPGLWARLRDVFYLFVSLPLVIYLSLHLGRSVWRLRLWSPIPNLDWIIARLFATAARHYLRADRILEAHGEPAEGAEADEKLAFLYLRMGGAQRAEQLFSRLLEGEDAPLGPYRQACVRVGLGETYLQLGRPRQALPALRKARPVLVMYGDEERGARAHELLAEALAFPGEEKEAFQHLATSCRWYQEREKWVEATRLVERLETRLQTGRLAEAEQARAEEVIASLQRRHYPGSYRHPLLVHFRQLVLMLIPTVLILVPLLTISLETGVTLAPEIRFRPSPLLDEEQTIALDLSQGVTAVDVSRVIVLSRGLFLSAAAAGFAYLALSLAVGLAAIAFTPLRTVQARGRGAMVCLDDEGITVGEGVLAAALAWTDVSQFVKADIRLRKRPVQDSSFGLGATQEPLVISGGTEAYGSLRHRVSCLVPAAAEIVDLDYTVLHSKLGVLYVLNVLLIGLLGILGARGEIQLLLRDAPGTPYSAADLYPYLFLGLIVAPLWWGVMQRLQRRQYLQPRSRLPLWMLGMGLSLALLQVVLRFRPLFTVVNLYLPLVTLVLLASAEMVVWRAQVAGQKVFPARVRIGTAAVATVACILMMSVLWRDTRAYHYLVQGNTLRDRGWKTQDADLSKALLTDAINAYERAADIGRRAIWGLDTRPAARIALGIPDRSELTWLSALTSQAALQMQLGQYREATRSYSETLRYVDRQDRLYGWRALARQSPAIEAADEEGPGIEDRAQGEEAAIRDLDDAIRLNPHNAAYYLWRGVARHALGQLDEALDDYTKVLEYGDTADGRPAPGREELRARALTGQGWIGYAREDYAEALRAFQQAKEANPETSDAWLGEGYALYALKRFEDAQPVWEKAATLDTKDPTVLISLGTLHWKFGGSTGEALGRNSCEEYSRSVRYFTEAVEGNHQLWRSEKDVVFTYRTRGYVQYLLAPCPGFDKAAVYEDAVDSFSAALALDPEHSEEYLYRRGRLKYSVATTLRRTSASEANEWLFEAIEDFGALIERSPDDAVYWHDRGWMSYRVWDWEAAEGPEAQEWLFGALEDMEKARSLDPKDRDDIYRPNWWLEQIQPESAQLAFGLALASLAGNDVEQSSEQYGRGLELAAASQNMGVVMTAAGALRGFLLMRPDVSRSGTYWPLQDEVGARESAVATLSRPDLYWRYRAEFGFRLLAGGGLELFREGLGEEESWEELFANIIADIERAYALNPDDDNKRRRDFIADANIGWLYLRRGDSYREEEAYRQALTDYQEATRRIKPASEDAARDLTEATFKAGFTALVLKRFEQATTWYDKGIELAEQHGAEFDLGQRVDRAATDLRALLQENSDLAPVIEPILDRLAQVR